MAKRRKPKRFRAVSAVKALARERLGAPRPTRRLPASRKSSPPKHRPTFGQLLSQDEE